MASVKVFTVVEDGGTCDGLVASTNNKGEKCLLIESSGRAEHGLAVPAAVLFIAGEVVGGGLVAIGSGVVNLGVCGIAILIIACLVNYFCATLFSRCFIKVTTAHPELRKDSRNAYTNIIRTVIGHKAATVSVGLFHVFALSVTTIYLLISADLLSLFLKSLLPTWTGLQNFRLWVAVYAGFLYPLTLFGTPKDFWAIAMVAVVTTAVSMVFIVSKLLVDSSHGIYTGAATRSITPSSFFSGIGTILFAFCGVPFFPNIQADMKRAKSFSKAVTCGYFTILLMYFPMGLATFFILGDLTRDNVLGNSILTSDTGAIKILPYASIILLSFHFVFAYILIFNSMAQEVEGMLKIPNRLCWQRCFTRACIVLVTLILAVAIPDFSVLISLCGGSLQVVLSFFFPITCYWLLHDLSLWQKIGLVELGIVAGVCCAGSVYASIVNVIHLYAHSSH